MKPCPLCGKPMVEQESFPGLWTCPDYAKPLNDRAPFEYKCTGAEATPEACEAFKAEVMRIICERN